MSLRINTNLSSLSIQNAMHTTQRETDRAIKNLATGSRISEISADTAGSAMASQLNSNVKGLSVAQRNAEQGTSLAEVAEGSLSEQSNLVVRMRELAIQSASDTYSDRERIYMQNEFQNLQAEIDRIAQTSAFGSQRLLDGSSRAMDIQVGTTGDASSRITFDSEADSTLSGLGISGVGVRDKSEARDTLDSLDEALNKISLNRSKYGALQSRLESAQNYLGYSIENLTEAKSQISDADVAKEVSDLRRGQILQQYQSVLLQQSNDQTGLSLRLLG